MSKRIKLMILIVAFGVVMFGATMLYDYLKVQISDPKTNISSQGTENSSSSSSSESDVVNLGDFTVEDLEGAKVNFSEFEGKAAVLNFWATWCGYCKQEMPDFNDLYNIYKDEEIEFMMINVTDGDRETKEMVLKYLENENYDFPVYLDHKGEFYGSFGQRSLPLTVIVDKEHNIIGAYVGVAPRAGLEEQIKKALE